jgi:hypothetical protein
VRAASHAPTLSALVGASSSAIRALVRLRERRKVDIRDSIEHHYTKYNWCEAHHQVTTWRLHFFEAFAGSASLVSGAPPVGMPSPIDFTPT